MPPPDVPARRRRGRGIGTKIGAGEAGRKDHVAEILDATRSLLASVSVDELAVADILVAAGVSRATFYGYFPSKHAVVGALADAEISDIFETLWRPWFARFGAPDGPRYGHAHTELTEVWIRTIARWRSQRTVMLAAAQGWRAHPEAYASWTATFERYTGAVREAIEGARAAGAAPLEPAAGSLAALLMWMSEGALYVSLTGHVAELEDDDERARSLATVLLRAIFGHEGRA